MNRYAKKLGNYMKEHTETSNSSDKNASTAKHSFKIKSRIASISPNKGDKQSKLQRAMNLSYNP